VHLVLTARKGVRSIAAQLLTGTTEVAKGQVELKESSCSVRFARQGGHVLVLIDERPVIDQQL